MEERKEGRKGKGKGKKVIRKERKKGGKKERINGGKGERNVEKKEGIRKKGRNL